MQVYSKWFTSSSPLISVPGLVLMSMSPVATAVQHGACFKVTGCRCHIVIYCRGASNEDEGVFATNNYNFYKLN